MKRKYRCSKIAGYGYFGAETLIGVQAKGRVSAKMGREYLLNTQELDIYGTAAAYHGPVRLIHGTRDSIVPMRCSEEYLAMYGACAELIKIEGENHTITRKRKEVVAATVAFFKEVFGG